MIKEKEKKKNGKTLNQVLLEYARTVGISFLAALLITLCLSFKAREAMIRNLYISAEERQKIQERIARQLILESDLNEKLNTKNYAICMQVGNLYAAAKDYRNAEVAYSKALERTPCTKYTPYYKLTSVLIAQEKYDEAEDIIKSVADVKNKNLVKFKSRAYIEMGDKYYSHGKFLKAAKCYEKAKYYYDRFSKKDKKIDKSITSRIVNSYSDAATVLVKQGYDHDAVRFLKKAEFYAPDDFHIKYKLAIIYADLDPIMSVEYFEPLLKKMPQYIDYNTYNKALIKSANICELEGNAIKAKQYRYRSHSIDLLINQKVIYKNDIEVKVKSFNVKKFLFRYHLNGVYTFQNVSNLDIYRMFAEFVLKDRGKIKEIYTVKCVNKQNPLYSNGYETDEIEVKFGKNIFTKKELSNYTIEVYVYKDEKFKTFLGAYAIPTKGIKKDKIQEDLDTLLGN